MVAVRTMAEPRTILLNPGPVTMSERVRAALASTDICHREEEFAELMLDVKRRLCGVHEETRADYDAIVLTGSGTAAVEAMLASLVGSKDRVLIAANGVYGERMAAVAERHAKSFVLIDENWTAGLSVGRIADELDKDSTISHVATVHHETTTGRLNDLAALGSLCRDKGKRLLLDSVSSFGAEEIGWQAWNIAAAAGTANKCLHGAPGLSFVIVRKDVLSAEPPEPAGTLYLDLRLIGDTQRAGFSPFTPATHVAIALREALIEFEEEGGRAARHRLYRRRSSEVRRTASDSGLTPLIPYDDMASMLSAFNLPAGLTYRDLHDGMRDAGFVIYAGQGRFASSIFRIAVMGDIGEADMARLLPALSRCIGSRDG
jgi:2-aminoethylphosphonate-pyruvate transaminase